MSLSTFNIMGIAKSDYRKSSDKGYSMLLIESTYYKGSNLAKTYIPCVIYNNNYKIDTSKSIKGKVIGVNGYISSYQNVNSSNDYPSISLVVSELVIFDSFNTNKKESSNSDYLNDIDDNEEEDDNNDIDDSDLPF